MSNGTLVVQESQVGSRRPGLSAAALFAVLALVLTMVVLVPHRADAAPAGRPVAAEAAFPGIGGGISAQTDFNQFRCATLLAIRNAFAGSPFFAFIVAAIDSLLATFDCLPSHATHHPPPHAG